MAKLSVLLIVSKPEKRASLNMSQESPTPQDLTIGMMRAVLQRTADGYHRHDPEADLNWQKLYDELLWPMIDEAEFTGEHEAAKMNASTIIEGQPFNPFSVVRVAVAFCADAYRRLTQDDLTQDDLIQAIEFASEGMYWSGVLLGLNGLAEVDKHSVGRIPRTGGKTKDELYYRPTRHYAYQLVKERMPEGGWKKVTDATRAIEADVVRFSEAHRAVDYDRIYAWLRNMPDSAQFFVSRRKKDQPQG